MPKKVETKAPNNAFAVIKTGGKQYSVTVGEIIRVEKLGDNIAVGGQVTFDEVLLHVDGDKVQIGTPLLKSKVTAEFLGNEQADKIRVTRFKSKSNRHRTYGHRQPFSRVKITAIA